MGGAGREYWFTMVNSTVGLEERDLSDVFFGDIHGKWGVERGIFIIRPREEKEVDITLNALVKITKYYIIENKNLP